MRQGACKRGEVIEESAGADLDSYGPWYASGWSNVPTQLEGPPSSSSCTRQDTQVI